MPGPEVFKNIQSSLKDGAYLDDEWDKFKLHFEQVHPSFFTDLRSAHPTLTKHELRLYAYFHINMSTKEIAALLNIAPASVRQAKARLNKKMSM
jgi:DNA-binding NarL/FixJ family response regulator